MQHEGLNARILAATDAEPVLRELACWSAGPPADATAAVGAGGFLAVALEDLSPEQSNLLEKAAGPLSRNLAVRLQVPGTGRGARAVIFGDARAAEWLVEHLAAAGGDAATVAEEIRAAIDNYGRRRFEIPLGGRRLEVGPRPALVGIVNVTPDSFSDGGRFFAPDAAISHGRRLADEGADVLDVGGESTRPGSDPVEVEEELRRVMPVIEGLARTTDVPISIDTRHARVAREATAAGAVLINDVTGLLGDPEMAAVAAASGAAVVIMHIAGEPKTMQDRPHYDNLMAEVCARLRHGLAVARNAGVPEDRTIIDPGIGFGKTLQHNLELLARLGQLRSIGRPIMVGVSRKRFIGQLTGVETPADRVFGTAAACAMALAAGALLLRVHDVRQMRETAAVAAAVKNVVESAR